MRNAAHFGAPPIDYQRARYPTGAAEAVAALDHACRTRLDGVAGLDEATLARPVGPPEPFPNAPMSALVLHIHREAIHHLAEVLVLRDLYRHRS